MKKNRRKSLQRSPAHSDAGKASFFGGPQKKQPFFSKAVKGPAIQRIPDEEGIQAETPRYSYSTHCGWIDWGHASPGMTTRLIETIRAASDRIAADPQRRPETIRTPEMLSQKFGVTVSGITPEVRILRPLSEDEVLRVALRTFMLQSKAFERLQGWTDVIAHSSFSEEDLTSNLISFYRAARDFDRPAIERICDVWSPEQSLAEFERYTFQRNQLFRPPQLPGGGAWPQQLSDIQPADTFGSLMEYISITAQTALTGPVRINVRDRHIFSSGNLQIEPVGFSADAVNISNTESGSENGPHFEVQPLPESTDMRFRWIISDDQNRSYRMYGEDGQVFQYGPQFNAYIGSGTRALLRERGIRSATVKCRVTTTGPGAENQLLELPVRFSW